MFSCGMSQGMVTRKPILDFRNIPVAQFGRQIKSSGVPVSCYARREGWWTTDSPVRAILVRTRVVLNSNLYIGYIISLLQVHRNTKGDIV